MSVPILSCPCGLRMKAKGAIPGRVGRCPKCGQTLTVPDPAKPELEDEVEVQDEPEPEPEPEAEPAPVARGYDVPSSFRPRVTAAADRRAAARAGAKRRAVEPARLPEVAVEVEPWWRPTVLFPLRGAEGLMIVAMLGLAFWVSATLIPELCLGFVADSARLGATLMGWLISLIVALPALALGFFAVAYALLYLGRVLVSGAMGEVVPPRPPDRNVEGLASSLGPWLIWLVCGASAGLGPMAIYLLTRTWDEPARPMIVAALALVGLPYALMALMMTFVDDGGFPRPNGVLGALLRFPGKALGIAAVEGGLGLVVAGAFAGMLMLREISYWIYVPLMLPCWMLAIWAAIVGSRLLGVFYYHHASTLRWHREKPWWGMTGGA